MMLVGFNLNDEKVLELDKDAVTLDGFLTCP